MFKIIGWSYWGDGYTQEVLVDHCGHLVKNRDGDKIPKAVFLKSDDI